MSEPIHVTLSRDPLDAARSVAERFMQIDPIPPTYMYGVGLQGIVDLYAATGESCYLDFLLRQYGQISRQDSPYHFNVSLFEATKDRRWLVGAAEAAESYRTQWKRDREGVCLDPRGRYTVDVFSGILSVPVSCAYALGDALSKGACESSGALRGFEALVEAAQDEIGDVRVAAVDSLQRVSPPEGQDSKADSVLEQAGRDPHYWVRQAAAE